MARHVHVYSHSRLRVFATRALVALLALAGGYLVFEFGRIQAEYNVIDAAREREVYEQRITELQAEILSLNEQIALLKTHRDIDREAYQEVETSLGTLQAKIQEQEAAIAFYRGIVSPADGNSGLRVQDLRLTRGQDERTFGLRLVLVQSLQHDVKVSGDVELIVEGTQGGQPVQYPYDDLLPEAAEHGWAFSFRYFQNFDREIVLPDGFMPERIRIAVHSRTRSIASIEESFPWANNLG